MSIHGLKTILASGLLAVSGLAIAQIERVEPPFWWQGFEHDELQIMVYGEGISDYVPEIDYEGVAIERVLRADSPNYLFIYVSLDHEAKPGSFDIRFTNDDDTLTHRYELRQKSNDLERTRGFSQRDAIYLVTPDRFANGDTSNDTLELYADGLDRDDDYGRHGGDLAGLDANLDYIRDMGYTQIWLNPILENAVDRASYHGYSTTDYYKVDPRFGSNEQFLAITDRARAMGIGMIMDQIVNHIGDGHWWMDDLPTGDWLNFQREPVITSHSRTVNHDAYASEYDRKMHADGWFVETMPDLNQRNPLLADYLVQNSIWWIEYAGLTGIRQDTWPYPDKHFMSEWSRRIMQEYPHFNIVGEEWTVNPVVVSYWQRGKINKDGYVSHLPSLFDFPLQEAVRRALTEDITQQFSGGWWHVYWSLANDILYPDPFNLVIFPDNHDMDRVYTQLGEDFDLYRMAMVLYSTMRGIPQFYYGDEILMSHTGTSSHGALRIDMPGGFPGDRANAFEGRGLKSEQRQAQALMRRLLNWRKSADVIHHGQYMHYAPMMSVFAYFRYDDDDTVMVVFNRGEETAELDLDRFHERIGPGDTAEDVLTGKRYALDGSMTLEPRSVLLLEVTHGDRP